MVEKAVAPTRKKRRYFGALFRVGRQNYMVLGFGLLLLLGASVGTSLFATAESSTLGSLTRLTQLFVENRSQQNFYQNFVAAAVSSLTAAVVLFLCGFSAVAQPLELLVPFVRGLGFGFSVASIYNQYGTGAAGYVALFILPGMVGASVVILFCCRESLRLSRHFFRLMNGGEGTYTMRLYLARYGVAALLCVALALGEACLGLLSHFVVLT